jgi:hypothetical protein
VPHPCDFFLSQGWETTNLKQRKSGCRILYSLSFKLGEGQIPLA